MHNGEASMRFTDTTPEAQARYLTLIRAMTPQRRFKRAVALSALARKMAVADVKRQNPGATERELAVALVRRIYGNELADRFAAQQARP